MPGIFGFYKRARSQSIAGGQLIDGMMQALRHSETYCSDTYYSEDLGAGTISVNDKVHHDIFIDEKNEIVVCINGHIFGFIGENAKETVSGRGIPGIIAEMYMKYGSDLPGVLNGDYNVVILDRKQDQLFIFNDRFGYRRLYWYQDDDIVMFSPEIKAFLQHQGFDKTMDEQGIANYFQFYYVLGDNTLFRRIKVLPPASYLLVDRKGVRAGSYWKPRYVPHYGIENMSEAVETGYELFVKSMRQRLDGSRNALIPLSGGLDSRLITGVASALGHDFSTVTMGIPGCGNHRIARKVAGVLGEKEPILMAIDPGWLKDFAEHVTWLSECGYASLGMSRLYGFAKVLGTDYDCFLNGIFGGHMSFGSPFFRDFDLNTDYTEKQRIARLIRGLDGLGYGVIIEDSATDELNEMVSCYGEKTIREEWARTEHVSDLDIYRQDYLFLYNRLRRAISSIDLNRFFYNTQHPFASYELFDFYLQLKPELLLDHCLYKEIYKTKLPELAKIKYQNTGVNLYRRPSAIHLAEEKIRRKFFWYSGRLGLPLYDRKAEYWEDVDYRKKRSTRDWARQILLSDSFLGRGFFRREGVKRILELQDQGKGAFGAISQMIMLELFMRRFVD